MAFKSISMFLVLHRLLRRSCDDCIVKLLSLGLFVPMSRNVAKAIMFRMVLSMLFFLSH